MIADHEGPTQLDAPERSGASGEEQFARFAQSADPPGIAGGENHQVVDAPVGDRDDAREIERARETDPDCEIESEVTIDRGSHPPRPSSSRRISPALALIFGRRRAAIGLSLTQLAALSGIDESELDRFEATGGHHRLLYDHAVVIARVLGLQPDELPGLRSRTTKKGATFALETLTRALLEGPLIGFTRSGQDEECFSGDVDHLGAPWFTLRIDDESLDPQWPTGALLGFAGSTALAPGEVGLLRYRRTRQLALRRALPPAFCGLASWQPAYLIGGDWLPIGRMAVILPRGD